MNHLHRTVRYGAVTLAFLGLILLGSGNAAGGNSRPPGGASAARLDREFKLRSRQQVTLKGENLSIRFAEVTEDSRCPTDVQCVWAGNAAVRLQVSSSGRRTRSLTLNTTANSPPVKYRNYEIKLVEVKPYPRSTRKIAQRDYVVTLLVNRT